MEIVYLADNLEVIPQLAIWDNEGWDELYPDDSIEQTVEKFQQQTNRDKIPMTILAKENDVVIGTASLVEDDFLPNYEHLSPWLASLYVVEEKRRQGIGQKLIERILLEAKKININIVYLWTEKSASLYEKLGWKTIATTSLHGHEIIVMQFDLFHDERA